eukprot:Gb_28590 [translate_table: standard]
MTVKSGDIALSIDADSARPKVFVKGFSFHPPLRPKIRSDVPWRGFRRPRSACRVRMMRSDYGAVVCLGIMQNIVDGDDNNAELGAILPELFFMSSLLTPPTIRVIHSCKFCIQNRPLHWFKGSFSTDPDRSFR